MSDIFEVGNAFNPIEEAVACILGVPQQQGMQIKQLKTNLTQPDMDQH